MSDFESYVEVMAKLQRGLPPAADSGFLGTRLNPEQARLLLLPVPWEATTTYGGGTADGPTAIVQASHQLDLEDGAFGTPYRAGIAFLPEPQVIRELNETARPAAQKVIRALEQGQPPPPELDAVNAASRQVNETVYASAKSGLSQGKLLGLVGGDHSSPLGLIQALAEREEGGFGILHFDAHHDLRETFEGFAWSHASIMRNVMEGLPRVSLLVSVGIRDYSWEERLYMQGLGERGRVFHARDIFRMQAEGEPFRQITRRILESLPERVYVSFDIDALDPPYCPSTGTPVPGGFAFDEACYLLEALAHSGRQVIGFDLCEVAPAADGDEWDANVGARLLYKLCGCLLRSQGLC